MKDHYLGNDIQIKKDTVIGVNILEMHYNPDVFENPFEYNPDRWFDEKNLQKMNKNIFIPFAIGPRKCIGEKLAYIELKITAIMFLKRFVFKVDKNYKLEL